MRPRVIPVLLVEDRYVVKTVRFRRPVYIGDPINSVKIFNEKEVDELTVLDIVASQTGRGVDFDFVEQVVSEAFMPIAYGGGIGHLRDAERLFALGVEKVVLNTALFNSPGLVSEVAASFGSQAVVASIDVSSSRFKGTAVAMDRGRRLTGRSPVAWARELQERGAGEILLTRVQREGTRTGYDLALIADVAPEMRIPVIAHGGAGTLHHLRQGIDAGASAVAAGSLFVQHGDRRAVLLTYPSDLELNELMRRDA